MDFHPDDESEAVHEGFDYPEPAAEQSFEGGFLTAADEGFVSPPPQERKERRYSGMEIPFGVIEATTEVAELNPLRNSKRLSTLGLFPSIVEETSTAETTTGERSPMNSSISPVNNTNPLSINRRASLNPLSSRNKAVSSDEIPFGITETNDRIGSEVNPMRTSAKYKAANSPATSPKKPDGTAPSNCSFCAHFVSDHRIFFVFATEPTPEPVATTTTENRKPAFTFSDDDVTTTSATHATPARQNITVRDVPIVHAVSGAIHIVLLFIYILLEILYELGLDAIKPGK